MSSNGSEDSRQSLVNFVTYFGTIFFIWAQYENWKKPERQPIVLVLASECARVDADAEMVEGDLIDGCLVLRSTK